jgi:hypothetical protein
MKYQYAVLISLFCLYPWTASVGSVGERTSIETVPTFNQMIDSPKGLGNSRTSETAPSAASDGLPTGIDGNRGLWTVGNYFLGKRQKKELLLARSRKNYYHRGCGRYSAKYFRRSYKRSRYYGRGGKRFYSRGRYCSYCGRTRISNRLKYFNRDIGTGRGKYFNRDTAPNTYRRSYRSIRYRYH